MESRIQLLLFTLIISTSAQAQTDLSQAVVSASLLQKHVFTLASDSLQGRATGTNGQLRAAFYITQSLRQNRLLPVFRLDSVRGSFYQPYTFTLSEVSLFGSSRGSNRSPAYKRYDLLSDSSKANDSDKVFIGHNVAGLLIGTDLKQEVVVVSAHYDHLGYAGKQIFHGADDNASGTASVLSIAAMVDSLAQQGIRPRRSILFILFSGEEGGLLGSGYFVHNSPIPLQQMVCDINIDMIGRIDYAHRKKPDYCYVIADRQTNSFLKTVAVANKRSTNLSVNQGGYDTETDPEQHFYRSDQYTFARFDIPALLFTSGNHSDYHRPSDTADKINYRVLQKRATLILQTIWLAANE